jgi:hypothetical protein
MRFRVPCCRASPHVRLPAIYPPGNASVSPAALLRDRVTHPAVLIDAMGSLFTPVISLSAPLSSDIPAVASLHTPYIEKNSFWSPRPVVRRPLAPVPSITLVALWERADVF